MIVLGIEQRVHRVLRVIAFNDRVAVQILSNDPSLHVAHVVAGSTLEIPLHVLFEAQEMSPWRTFSFDGDFVDIVTHVSVEWAFIFLHLDWNIPELSWAESEPNKQRARKDHDFNKS